IADLKAGRNAVLQGDTVGGSPSIELARLAADRALDGDDLDGDSFPLDEAVLAFNAKDSDALTEDALSEDILAADALDVSAFDHDDLAGDALDINTLDINTLDSDLWEGEAVSLEALDEAAEADSLEIAPPDTDRANSATPDSDPLNSDTPRRHTPADTDSEDHLLGIWGLAPPNSAAGEQDGESDSDALIQLIPEAPVASSEAAQNALPDTAPDTAPDIAPEGEAAPEALDHPEAAQFSEETAEPPSGDVSADYEQSLEAIAADDVWADPVAVDDTVDLTSEANGAESDLSEPLGSVPETSVAPSASPTRQSQAEFVADEATPTPPAASPAPSRPQPPRPRRTRALASNLTVRVDADRLSRMNNLLGELTISRNGLDLQNTQAQRATRQLRQRFERFQNAVEAIRTFSDQLLIADQHVAKTQRPARDSLNQSLQDFDTLEMDRYSTLYAQTQVLLEEIVQLEESMEDVSLFTQQSGQMLNRHRKMLSNMQDELMWARMLPIGNLLNRFPRMIRDLSNQYEKPVQLELKGTELLVDKAVLEKLYDPLLHLLRNGFDHGIEPIAERQRRDKPAEGKLSVTAVYRGRQVVIEVRDDGRGLNSDRIRQRAVDMNLLPASEVEKLNDQDLQELIFQPGFSTADQVSDLSGRGVGLDVVREQVRELNGSVTVTSRLGEGTTFTLTLPLTLSVLNLLICFTGSTPLAVRSNGITEVVIPKPGQTSRSGDRVFFHWKGRTLPVYHMSDLLAYNCLIPETPPSRILSAVPSPADWDSPVLVLRREGEAVAIQVDRLVTEQELVVKPFGQAISPPGYAYGCTVLGDGSLVPVVDGLAFLETVLAQYEAEGAKTVSAALERAVQGANSQDEIQMTEAVTLLVIDDAVTSRRTLALSLERAGYRVLQARDGQEGLEQLGQNPDVQLIVCDVEMPVMNGFEFLTHRRQTPPISAIPTVMLTSRSNDKHRWLAKQLGATDYFTKPYLEQEFLKAIEAHIEATEKQMAAV
ncbi:MAG: response regulator, partial [Elainellaceae cyanobacterium]